MKLRIAFFLYTPVSLFQATCLMIECIFADTEDGSKINQWPYIIFWEKLNYKFSQACSSVFNICIWYFVIKFLGIGKKFKYEINFETKVVLKMKVKYTKEPNYRLIIEWKFACLSTCIIG